MVKSIRQYIYIGGNYMIIGGMRNITHRYGAFFNPSGLDFVVVFVMEIDIDKVGVGFNPFSPYMFFIQYMVVTDDET